MFKDRFDAANQLVMRLKKYSNNPDTIILAIPRGGVQLGYVLAKELHLPLDVIFTKKIGHPGNPEFAIGAVSTNHIYISPDFVHEPQLNEYIEQQTIKIRKLLHERTTAYRGDKPALNLTNKIVIIVDDGVATGHTLSASMSLVRQDAPKKIIVALPVAPANTLNNLRKAADEVICLNIPDVFFGVGQFYQNFEQIDDNEAIRLLHGANV